MPKKHEHRMSREEAARLGRETVEICEAGKYTAPSGKVVDIEEDVWRAREFTKSYPPTEEMPQRRRGNRKTFLEIRNETTLTAAERLLDNGLYPVLLNFASATGAGGGFLRGSRAQEEYLARSSALFNCLRDNPMYAFHRERRNRLYSNYVVYSPAVPVFRTDAGELLDMPYNVAMISSPAVRNSRLKPAQQMKIGPVMLERILKVLYVGLRHGHDSLILGAWGCGAFRNDPYLISSLFRQAIEDNFHGVYRHISFAITDWSRDRHFIEPFRRNLTDWHEPDMPYQPRFIHDSWTVRQEMHHYSLEVVVSFLKRDGYRIRLVKPGSFIHPNIIAAKDGRVQAIVVRSAVYPQLGYSSAQEQVDLWKYAVVRNMVPCIARVGLANAAAENEKERHHLKSGANLLVAYPGLEILQREPALILSPGETSEVN